MQWTGGKLSFGTKHVDVDGSVVHSMKGVVLLYNQLDLVWHYVVAVLLF